jgi:hypothetical protein
MPVSLPKPQHLSISSQAPDCQSMYHLPRHISAPTHPHPIHVAVPHAYQTSRSLPSTIYRPQTQDWHHRTAQLAQHQTLSRMLPRCLGANVVLKSMNQSLIFLHTSCMHVMQACESARYTQTPNISHLTSHAHMHKLTTHHFLASTNLPAQLALGITHHMCAVALRPLYSE